ncbi:hypothetical protein [Neisseria dentiae]|uniref:hypothetical protein n=1 Tax=Neisseria dentiae TaxID=194197 RepID=UPI00211CBD55|nr:hypothetical protein [Neisseria dentiae]MCQ9325603.1 hypothetical protein [Neisseria dentiae]
MKNDRTPQKEGLQQFFERNCVLSSINKYREQLEENSLESIVKKHYEYVKKQEDELRQRMQFLAGAVDISADKTINKYREQLEENSLESIVKKHYEYVKKQENELRQRVQFLAGDVDISADKTIVSEAVRGVGVTVSNREPPIRLIREDDYDGLLSALARLNGLKSAKSDKVQAKKEKRAEMIKKYEASGMSRNNFAAAYASSFGYVCSTARDYLKSGNLLKFKENNPDLFN